MTSALDRLLWTQLWQVTVVGVIALWLTRRIGVHRPRLTHAICIFVVVRSLTPPVFSCSYSAFSWCLASRPIARADRDNPGPRTEPPLPASDQPRVEIRSPEPMALPAERAYGPRLDSDQIRQVALAIWVAGIGVGVARVLLKWSIARHVAIRGRRRISEAQRRLILDLSRRLDLKKEVELVVSSEDMGPLVFGLRQPTIVLPRSIEDATDEQMTNIIAHELLHIKRKDIVLGMIQTVAEVLWWFHPLVRMASRRATQAREMCCDDDVMRAISCAPLSYHATLIFVQRTKLLRSVVGLPGLSPVDIIDIRLEYIMISACQKKRRLSTVASGLAYLVGAIVLGPGAGLTLEAQQVVVSPTADMTPAGPSSWGNGLARVAEQGPDGSLHRPVLSLPQVKFELFYINSQPAFVGILDRDTGLAIFKNEWAYEPPVFGRVTKNSVEAFGMVAPISRRPDGTVSLMWPGGPGCWESKEPVDLRTEAMPGSPPVPQPRFQRYWINGRLAFICVLDRSTGLAILKNEWVHEPPVFGRVTKNSVEAFGMVAPIERKGGMLTVRWPGGPGFWEREVDIFGPSTINKGGIEMRTKVSERPNGEIVFTNEADNESPASYTDATRMVLRDWKDARGNNLTVTIDDNGDVQIFTFSDGNRWIRQSPTP
jgi:beta-lactamase regulating signal transducer with metallopeptidase domain